MLKSSLLRCSFCGRDETRVAKLVAGPKATICDACVAAARRIMENSDDGKVKAGPWSPADGKR